MEKLLAFKKINQKNTYIKTLHALKKNSLKIIFIETLFTLKIYLH
jgi:hypothetical protein